MAQEEEARGTDLLPVALAWPLCKRLAKASAKIARRFKLVDYLAHKDTFTCFAAHDFKPDTISAWVTERSKFTETYARPIRVARDSELNDKTADSLAHDVMPQFNLRNIGRYEMAVDVEGGLPWQRQKGVGGDIHKSLVEVRSAKLQRPEPIQIWTVDYVTRLRAQLRRLVIEDPWEMKYGPEATSVHNGLGRNYIVDGTHPDDQADADFAPTLIARPLNWQATPKGQEREERPFDIAVDAARLTDKTGSNFEL